MRKKFLKGFIWFLVLLNLAIVVTGKTYLYKAVWYNFADIDDYKIFDNTPVPATDPVDWAIGADYNRSQLTDSLEAIHARLQSVAFVIIKNDSIRYEQYWEGYSDSSLSNSFSMAKTIVSILVGIAIDEGKIKSLDQPVGDFIPEFRKGTNTQLTIRHLITMSSGLNWDESYSSPLSVTTEAYYGKNLYDLVAGLKVVHEPGKVFEYMSGNTELLALILQKATGKSLSAYASEKLWTPIHAVHTALWSTDKPGGNEKAYCCFNSNARDFARIGSLFLHNGNWNGKQVVSEKYVNESTTPAPTVYTDGQPNSCYGYQWWLLNYKGHKVFYARGILGQYVIVIPDEQMVVVRLGHKRGEPTGDKHLTDVYAYIEGAMEMMHVK
jgi:CubicO group peptidase (beta-lactamase class C family)